MKQKETCPVCGSQDVQSYMQFDENDDPAGLSHQCRECGHVYNTPKEPEPPSITPGDSDESPGAVAKGALASHFPSGSKTMAQLRADFRAGGYADAEMKVRQAVVKEHAERRGLTAHKGTALAKESPYQSKGLEGAFTVGVGTEIRIRGVPHILTKPGPGAGTWYNTEGELLDVAGAVQDDSLDYAAHRENPYDEEAKEVYDRESSAEAMQEASRRLEQLPSLAENPRQTSPVKLSGFLRKPGKRQPLLGPPKK